MSDQQDRETESDQSAVPRPRVGGQPVDRIVGAPAVQAGLAEALGLAPAAEAAILADLSEQDRDALSYAAATAREGLDASGDDVLIEDN